jgi:hypothetical protein
MSLIYLLIPSYQGHDLPGKFPSSIKKIKLISSTCWRNAKRSQDNEIKVGGKIIEKGTYHDDFAADALVAKETGGQPHRGFR